MGCAPVRPPFGPGRREAAGMADPWGSEPVRTVQSVRTPAPGAPERGYTPPRRPPPFSCGHPAPRPGAPSAPMTVRGRVRDRCGRECGAGSGRPRPTLPHRPRARQGRPALPWRAGVGGHGRDRRHGRPARPGGARRRIRHPTATAPPTALDGAAGTSPHLRRTDAPHPRGPPVSATVRRPPGDRGTASGEPHEATLTGRGAAFSAAGGALPHRPEAHRATRPHATLPDIGQISCVCRSFRAISTDARTPPVA